MTVSTEINATPPAPHWTAAFPVVGYQHLVRLLQLYAALVLFEFAHRYMLEYWLSDVFGYFSFSYDHWRSGTYFWVCVLTPLSVLPAGVRLESASHFMFLTFMTFVGLPTPIILVHFVTPDVFSYFYGCLFLSYTILAVCTRIYLRPIPSPLTERGYVRLLAITIGLFVAVLCYGITQQGFRLVDFSQLYQIRYSNETANVFVQRIATLYVFSFGGLFVAQCLMFRKMWLAAASLLAFIACYGFLYEKTAALAPIWFIYLYLVFKFFTRDSAVRFHIALAIPYYIGVVIFALYPRTANGGNILEFGYLALVVFRQYSATNLAVGLYYVFFQDHPHTYWSHITGIDYFIHYPYGNHSVAIEMENAFGLGNFNASFLATEGIEAYGYEALPFVSAAVGAVFILLNTAARRFGPQVLALTMIMPSLMIDERPFGTSLLTGGIMFLIVYLAWMPRSWLNRSQNV